MQLNFRYEVLGMDCAACANKVLKGLHQIEEIEEASASYLQQRAHVRLKTGAAISPQAIASAVEKLGYKVSFQGASDMRGNAIAVDKNGNVTTSGDLSAGASGQVAAHPVRGAIPSEDNHHAHDGHADAHLSGGRWWQTLHAKWVLGCGVVMALAYLSGLFDPQIAYGAFLTAMVVGLLPVARSGWASMRAGIYFSIETLMLLAAVGAVLIGSVEEAAMVVWLFLIGELLESITAGRARASIRALIDLVPKTAQRQNPDGSLETVSADMLAIGDVVVVRAGERIAADGDVIDGNSSVNEAPVTGESIPKEKQVGDPVYAGTVNDQGVLRVRVTAPASDNTIARIVRLVEEAQQAKAPTARFIDRFATYYTPFVVLVAALVMTVPPLFFGGEWGAWIYKGLALLLIGCPCALIISTPTAIAAALSAGARAGLLMKGGVVLETVGKVKKIAFDKTGTLTRGTPTVTDIVGNTLPEQQVLAICAALESGSTHPLAVAILQSASAQRAPLPQVRALATKAGFGVEGAVDGTWYFLGSVRAVEQMGIFDSAVMAAVAALAAESKSVSVLVALDDNKKPVRVCGWVALRDELRPGSAEAIALLHKMGIATLMLTGDNRATAEAIARELGMTVRAELLPQDKQAQIVAWKQSSSVKVAVVGDGINDAPALAAADVGIAMGGGTDVALESADAAILRGDIGDVPALLRLSRATMRNIYQNIAFALGFKGIFVVTTLCGLTGLWPAVLADTGASMIVTLNAMRLLRWKNKKEHSLAK